MALPLASLFCVCWLKLVQVGPLGKILFPEVYRLARGVDFARQDPADGGGAAVAGVADPEDGIDAEVARRLLLRQFGDLHDVGRVDDDDDLVEVLLDVLYERSLVVLQHQRMVGGVGMARHIVGGEVAVLSAHAGEGDDRRVVIAIVRGRDGPVVVADGHLVVCARHSSRTGSRAWG